MNSGDRKEEDTTDGDTITIDKPRKCEASRAWGILLFAVIGATATVAAVSHLRRSFDWFCTQLSIYQPSSKNGDHWKFMDEAWKRYNFRRQRKIEEELERMERIRRMQNIFNRERDKVKRSYESWREHGHDPYQHYHDAQHDGWHWKAGTSYKDQKADARNTSRDNGIMSHHYSVLGLDGSRVKPYTDAEIKTAFRAKAMEYHPDQNKENTELAEIKFKEVMRSYEAIKLERKNKSEE